MVHGSPKRNNCSQLPFNTIQSVDLTAGVVSNIFISDLVKYELFFVGQSSGKIPVVIPRFLCTRKNKNKKHRHSNRRDLVFLMVLSPLFIPH